MKKLCHILIPALMPLALYILYQTPAHVMGYRNHAILTLLITLTSGIAAIVTSVIGLRERMHGKPGAMLWIVSALILSAPLIALVVLS